MEMITKEETSRLCAIGRTIYETQLKAVLEPEYNGKVVAIHIDTGDYEVAGNSPTASKAIRARHPSGLTMVTTVGPAKMDGMPLRMMGWQGCREAVDAECEGVNSSR